MSQVSVRVRSITNEAPGINCYELVDEREQDLPPFAAGAHIDVYIPGGTVRQYSLCNDPRERHRYVIGVLKVEDGRGGSKAFHMNVRAGDALTVSPPRNSFSLVEDAERHLLIAGGIGVTPMMAMIERLIAIGADFTMHYCSRSPERTAFRRQLAPLVRQGRVIHHYDDGDLSKSLRIADVVRDCPPGTHLYVCGPAGLIDAAHAASEQWPRGTVHFESFTAARPRTPAATHDAAGGFEVRIASTGAVLKIRRGRSIVEVLREAGIDCNTSCEAGVCGTCRTRYLEGTPEHHDLVLDESERGEYVLICCARSKSELLVLDL